MPTRRVPVPPRGAEALYGNHDENLRYLEGALKVRLKTAAEELISEGSDADNEVVAQVFEQLGQLMKDGYNVAPGDVRLAAQLLQQDPTTRLRDYLMRSAIR